jgi:hypothetical protein
MTNKKSVTGKVIWAQIKADLIGKDSYRGVTLTYTWLANQFGHISLGFIPTLLVYRFARCQHDPSVSAALWVSLTWLAFETCNFLMPLLFKSKSKSRHIYTKGGSYQFQPRWGNIAFDTITDLCFFWNGAISASLVLNFETNKLYVLLGLWAVLLFPMWYWYVTKIYLQVPEFPFQSRLSQFDKPITEDDKKNVLDYLYEKADGQHLLIYGSGRSGKTDLGVGIATERAILHQPCTYTTAFKLLAMFNNPDSPNDIKHSPWNWLTGSVLVIDDINPGDPVKHELLNPKLFLDILKFGGHGDRNEKAIKNKNVIWILGNNVDRHDKDWYDMLIGLGVPQGNIRSVTLSGKA